LCSRHSTATSIQIGPMQPLKPVEFICPLCIAERLDARADERTGTETTFGIVGRNVTATDTPFMSARVAEAYEQWRAREAASGRLVAGSPEEEEGLAQADAARVDAIARDHGAHGGRVVVSRIIEGVPVDFVKVRGRRGLVAVSA
jgi:hypothetical protein